MKKVVPLREAVALIKPRQFMKLEPVPPCGPRTAEVWAGRFVVLLACHAGRND